MTHINESQLSDYVDGVLNQDDRADVERHLAECDACRDELEFLTTLVDEAHHLPRGIAPSRDLWSSIVARIDEKKILTPAFGVPAHPRRRWRVNVQLAAAAIALVVISSTVTAVVMRTAVEQQPAATLGASDAQDPTGTMAVAISTIETEYNRAFLELSTELEARRDQLDPETIAEIEENLRILDDAIAETRAALETNPSSSLLRSRFTGACQDKVELLERANRIATAES